MEIMIKKLFTLFKLGRKLAKSDALKIATRFNEPPLLVKVLFSILSFSFYQQEKLFCFQELFHLNQVHLLILINTN